jgi:hypothetical protein
MGAALLDETQADQRQHHMENEMKQYSTLLKNPQYLELQRGLIYVYRKVNGTDVPLLIENQRSYKEWLGCFSAI